MVQLLDCTLRDGAHVNKGRFGYDNIQSVASGLTKAGLDIVELGFLQNVDYDRDTSYFPQIERAYDILSQIETREEVDYALMARADEYDLSGLSDCNGKIKYIRVAFYYDYLDKAMEFAKKVMAKGYRITFNVINTPGNSVEDLGRVVDYANEIRPDILTIVDTFGVLSMKELSAFLDKYDRELDLGVKIGLHVHENLALAFSLAQGCIDYVKPERNIVIDGSLLGMGRIPGNLCTELIADYMNETFGKDYGLADILPLIDNIIAPIKKEIPWGYSPAYFLSAKYRIHRSYSEYLLKERVPLDVMNRLLGSVDKAHAGKFDKDYMNSLMEKIK